jgi:hypothetical protein
MDIYHILSSKPHNPHYLNRYIKFIESCRLKNIDFDGYTEKHHICPKASDMFPEYKSFIANPWNLVKLTPRQHYVAHVLLANTYPNIQSVWYSLFMLSNFSECKNTRLYEDAKNKFRKNLSKTNKNTKVVKTKNGKFKRISTSNILYTEGTSKNYIWINNYVKERTIDRNEQIPKGWFKGRLKKKEERYYITNGIDNKRIKINEEIPKGWFKGYTVTKHNEGSTGMIFITNGIDNTCIYEKDGIPEGWYKGRTTHTKRNNSSTKGKIWINNGETSKFHHKNELIPDGWIKGRLNWFHSTS